MLFYNLCDKPRRYSALALKNIEETSYFSLVCYYL